jgi:hypothetical protein
MKKLIFGIFLLASIGIIAGIVKAEGTGIIKGKVTSNGNNGIPGIMVQIFYCDSAPSCFHNNPLFLQVPTDESGNYSAVVPGGSDINPKKYWLIFNPYSRPPNGINYLPQGYNNKKPWNHATVPNPDPDLVTVVDGQYATYTDSNNVTTTSIDAQLDPGVVVTGTVYDPDTNPPTPINDAHIAAHLDNVWDYETMTGGYPISPGRYYITIPPDDGSYIQVYGGPNNYILTQRIYLPTPLSDHVNNDPIFQSDISSIPAYNPTYTNQTYQPDVDYYITNKGGKITGFVKDAVTGFPIENACVGVLDENGNWLTGSGLTSLNGSFTTPTLEVGPNYRLRVDQCSASSDYSFPEYYNGYVQVTRGVTSGGYDIGLRKPGIISVTIKNSTGRGIFNVNVLGINSSTGTFVNAGWTDNDGKTSFKVPAGSYRIDYKTYDSEGYYLSRSYNNGTPVSVSEVTITEINDTLTTGSQLSVDIKPEIYPNLIKSCEGTLSVAIFSTNDLKATKINPDTVNLLGIQPTYVFFKDLNGDNRQDLLLNFPMSAFNLFPSSSSFALSLNTTLEDRAGFPLIPVAGSDHLFVYDTPTPPTVFDDFALGVIDNLKWSPLVQLPNSNPTVSDGKLIIENEVTNSPSSKYSSIYFRNSSVIDHYKAKVKILSLNNPNGAWTSAQLGGFFYNDTFLTPNYTSGIGNIFGLVSIGSFGTNLEARWRIVRIESANYAEVRVLKEGIFEGVNVTIGEEYTLSVGWNGSEFAFSINGAEVREPVSGNIYPASNTLKYVRAYASAGPLAPGTSYSAYIKASFDDIEVPSMANYTPSCTTEPVQVQPVDTSTGLNPVTIIYDQITQCGVTTLTTSKTGPETPAGFQMGDPPTYYNLATTATVSGPRTVCINYSGIPYTDEFQLRLLHYEYENETWADTTTSLDIVNNIICGESTSFSPFAITKDLSKVWVDIKPGSDVNSINLDSQGLTPVAILSTSTFDARKIDWKTVQFAGVSPTKLKLEDVNKDGRIDLLLFFVTDELNLSTLATEATLSGTTVEGAVIWGSDMIRIVPQGKK